MRNRFILFAVALFMTACQPSAPARLGKPQFTGPAFQITAMDIEMVKSAPNVAGDVQERYQFPTRLDSGIEQWAKDRLSLRGGENILKLDIQESSVIEEPLPVEEGFMGLFKNEQSSRYTARLRVSLALYSSDRPTARAGADGESTRTMTLPEGASVAERQQAFNDLVIKVLQDIDAELSKRIEQNFTPYLTGY